MPLALSPADRRLLLIGGGVFAAIIAIAAVLMTGPGDRAEYPTTYSAGSSGAKATYRLLSASGYRVDRWQDEASALTDAAGTTLILAEPLEMPTEDEAHAIEQFLERGGRVIATGVLGAEYLGHAAIPDPLHDRVWARIDAVSPSAITRAAPAITLIRQAEWTERDIATPLYADATAPLVVHFAVGAGEAFWWASATPLTNAGLAEPGNLEFFLATLGPPRDRRVLFDEYVHGHRHSIGASILHSPVKWMAVQLGIFAVVVLLTFSRRSGPIVRPPVESRLSPLEFVRTLGALYRRAGAAAVALDAATLRFRSTLTRRLGVSSRASVDEIALAVRARGTADATALAVTLRACEAAGEAARLDARTALTLIRALTDHAAALRLHGLVAPATLSTKEHS